jgi:hypothetical protein
MRASDDFEILNIFNNMFFQNRDTEVAVEVNSFVHQLSKLIEFENLFPFPKAAIFILPSPSGGEKVT